MDVKRIKQLSLGKFGEYFIFAVILLNSIIIYLQVSGYESRVLDVLDMTCTLVFITEMLVKMYFLGQKKYWADGWNKMDGTLVFLSIPSLVTLFIPMEGANLSVLLALRLLRALRFFRLIRFFGDSVTQLARGFSRAMKASSSVLAAFLVIIVIFGLINCSLFGYSAPDFFGTPIRSVYSVFRLFTIEGWYEIPDSVLSESSSALEIAAIRLYFCFLLISGGIIGMSFINSVFVDAMAEDNNDEVLSELRKIEQQQKKIEETIEQLMSKVNGLPE